MGIVVAVLVSVLLILAIGAFLWWMKHTKMQVVEEEVPKDTPEEEEVAVDPEVKKSEVM